MAILFLSFLLLLPIPSISGTGKIDKRLERALESRGPDDRVFAWVYFTDKGSNEMRKASIPLSLVSERSLARRANVRPQNDLVDYTDLPVEESYLQHVAQLVRRVRQRSKWFNSVSVEATKAQILQLEALPFVRSIELLARFRRQELSADDSPRETSASPSQGAGTHRFDYGLSFDQLSLINVPVVHDSGNYGQGVIIGMFDNGVRLPNHEAFRNLNIMAQYDFVDHKPSVVPDNPAPSFGFHGVYTLSNIAAFVPGKLIGPAFGATYILARTENDSSETPIEEDNWVAAIEWAESLGVQVTSTSLGYLTYDPPYSSWTWQDMNGNTTVITRAADMAVSKGIVVLNSAGNNGSGSGHNTLNAPADGDSVITVGAVNRDGTRSIFSSVGPTTSVPPRIKPDVMAPGTLVRTAHSNDTTGYIFSQGTSHSCPLAAGVVALMLRRKPNSTPIQIIDALRLTASRATAPDNQFGWGIVNAQKAIEYLIGPDTNTGTPPTAFLLETNFPNPFPSPANPATTIRYALPQPSLVILRVFDALGREVRTLVNEVQPAAIHTVVWDGKNNSGNYVSSGIYFYRLVAGSITQTRKLVLAR